VSLPARADPPLLSRFVLRLALFYAGLLIVTGIQVPFFPLWLKSKGLDSRAIGAVLATPIVVRIFAVPVINRLADRHGDMRAALIVTSIASVLCFAIVGFTGGFAGILLAVAVAAIVFTPIGALADAYALRGLTPQTRAYGTVRLWGSVAFLVANLCAGWLLTIIAVTQLIWLIVGALAAMGIFALLLLPLGAAAAEQPADIPPVRHFWFSPRFLAVAAAAGLIQASHAIYYGFSAMDWTAKGFSSASVGMLWAIGVAAEIVLFALSRRFFLDPLALIALGAAGALLRWIAMGLNPSALLLPGLQCLHALSFGATHLGSVLFAAAAAHARQSATAQADFGTVLAIAGAATTAFSGVLYSALGDHAYLAMAAMVGVAIALLAIGSRLRR
jgi:PPP family 3-phenylpropionic acid transporter